MLGTELHRLKLFFLFSQELTILDSSSADSATLSLSLLSTTKMRPCTTREVVEVITLEFNVGHLMKSKYGQCTGM